MYMHGDTWVVLDQHATDTVVRRVRLGTVTPWEGKEEISSCLQGECVPTQGISLTHRISVSSLALYIKRVDRQDANG